jgi:D-sedoheptulose 7-phosphate isomerase
VLVAEVNEMDVRRLFEALLTCFQTGGKLLLFGCGGSSSNASHIASEFVSHWTGAKMPALALTTDPAVLTAIANDFGFQVVFSRQIEAIGQRGDFAIGLSTSGNAPSITEGLVTAGKRGLHTSLWTGLEGKKYAEKTDYPIVVEKKWTGTIQERHLELGHLMSDFVCKAIKI